MKKFLKITLINLFILFSPITFSGMRKDVISVKGVVTKYNDKYVYLKTSSGKLSIVPRASIVREDDLHSNKEIQVFVKLEDYIKLRNEFLKKEKDKPSYLKKRNKK